MNTYFVQLSNGEKNVCKAASKAAAYRTSVAGYVANKPLSTSITILRPKKAS